MKMHLICCAVALGAAACTHSSVLATPVVAQVDDGQHHIAIRAEAGRLWWAHRGWTEPHALCALPTEGRVENLAVAREPSGFVVTFDQGGTSWRGTLDEAPQHVTTIARSDR
jgi:hypothetical protein